MYIPREKQLRRFRIATGKRFFSKRFDFFSGMQRCPMSIVANYKQEKKRQEQKKKKKEEEWSGPA